MKILARLSVIGSLLFVFSSTVQAAGKPAYEETYNIGLLAGTVDGGAAYGTAEAKGFSLSARNKKAVLEYVNFGTDEGKILGVSDTWESNVTGFYLALIGEGQPYIKIKVGKVKHEMVQTPVSGAAAVETTSVTSYGLGMGYKIGSRIIIEAELTTLDNDMTLMAVSVLF